MKTLLLIVTLAFGSALGITGWPNEPGGSEILMDCPFSGSLCAQLGSSAGRSPRFVDSTFSGQQPASPSGALDQYLPVGATTGLAPDVWTTSINVPEIYVAFWWATSANSEWNRNNGNKIIFVKSSVGIQNNLLLWQGSPYGAKRLVWYPQSESNNCHLKPQWYGGCGSPGVAASGWFEPNGPHDGYVAAGSGWHLIEIYKKASTGVDTRDGIIRVWIDSQLSTNYTNINESPAGFTGAMFDHTWDVFGCDPYDTLKYPGKPVGWYRDCTKERHHWFDHLRVSRPRSAINASGPASPGGKAVGGRGERLIVIGGATESVARTGKAEFVIHGIGSSAYTLSVYDLAGRKVWNLERHPTRVSVQNVKMGIELKAGVYLVRLVSEGKQAAQRFTVMR